MFQTYVHFGGYEPRQLGQEEEEYEDTAEDGYCGEMRQAGFKTWPLFNSHYSQVTSL